MSRSDDSKPRAANGADDDLVAAIAERPDEVDRYLVYADWLTRQGDPLGELVALQARPAPRGRVIDARIAALFEEHAEAWLGPFGDEFTARFRWGFLRAATLGVAEPCPIDPAIAIGELFRLPTARFLRELELGDFPTGEFLGHGDALDYRGVVAAMTQVALPRTLRRLSFEPQNLLVGDVAMGDITALLAKLPGLEDLSMSAVAVELTEVDLPELRRLGVSMERTPPSALVRALASARLQKLEYHELSFPAADPSTLADLTPLFEGRPAPALKHLGLPEFPLIDELLGALVRAPIAGGLRTLDLCRRRGDPRLTRVGARVLLEGAQALVHLERIDLRGHQLARGVSDELERAFGARVLLHGDPGH